MKHSKAYKKLFVGTLWLLAFNSGLSLSAQTMAAQPVKNVLLVHGAWADAQAGRRSFLG